MRDRLLFLLFLVFFLFTAKALIIAQMGPQILISPDETVYGFETPSISNFSIYSAIPMAFGLDWARLFNAALTSTAVIPIFYLVRRRHNERNTALITTLIACLFGPLWLYSFTNMTEAMLFTGVLTSALLAGHPLASLHNALIKPIGLAVPLIYSKHGLLIALFLGLAFTLMFPATNEVVNRLPNALLASMRSITYILFASAGTAYLAGYRILNGQSDTAEEWAFRFLLITFAVVFAFMCFLPHNAFFGRYFDAPILVLLTTFRRPEKGGWFTTGLAVLLLISIIHLLVGGAHGIMDAGLMAPTDIINYARLSIKV